MAPIVALRAIRDLSDFAQIPALRAVVGAATIVLEELQASKWQNAAQDSLARQVAEAVLAIHEQFNALSGEDGEIDLPDEVLFSIAALNDALNRTHNTLMQQQNRKGGTLMKLLRAGPDADILKAAQEDVQRAMRVYFLQAHFFMARDSEALMTTREQNPAEMPPPPTRARSPSTVLIALNRVPPRPPLLIGRAAELDRGVRALVQTHIAITGAPGIGKTTLALAVLHDATCDRRLFISCNGHASVAALLAGLGASSEKQLLQAVHSQARSTILLLDAFEDPLAGDRVGAEALLERLCAVEGLRVIVSLRGAERPVSTIERHHLEPLDARASEQLFLAFNDYVSSPISPTSASPLSSPESATSSSSSWSAFSAKSASTVATSIASFDSSSSIEVQKIIADADGVPLALTLLAHRPRGNQASSSFTELEKDRLSNVISSSVAHIGPEGRITLALLARAPDGLVRSLLPRQGVTALLRTALASRYSIDGEEDERIRALAPVRAYALARLDAPVSELHRVRAWYIQLALRAQEIGGSATPGVVALLAREAANLTSILRDAFPDPDAIRAAVALAGWAKWVGASDADRSLVEAAVNALHVQHEPDLKLQADALLALARLYSPSSAESRRLTDESLEVARRAGDLRAEVDALSRRTVVCEKHDLPRLHRALEILDTMPEDEETDVLRAVVLLEIGQTHFSSTRIDLAASYFQRVGAMELPSALHLRARALWSNGHVIAYRGNPAKASAKYAEALAACEAAGFRPGVAHCISYQGFANMQRNRPREARALWLEAANRFAEMGYEMDELLARCNAVRAAIAMGVAAYDELGALPPQSRDWTYGRGVLMLTRGELSLHVGDPEAARDYFMIAREAFVSRGTPERIAECDMLIADIEEALEDAERHWVLALVLFRKAGMALGCIKVFERWKRRVDSLQWVGGIDER